MVSVTDEKIQVNTHDNWPIRTAMCWKKSATSNSLWQLCQKNCFWLFFSPRKCLFHLIYTFKQLHIFAFIFDEIYYVGIMNEVILYKLGDINTQTKPCVHIFSLPSFTWRFTALNAQTFECLMICHLFYRIMLYLCQMARLKWLSSHMKGKFIVEVITG